MKAGMSEKSPAIRSRRAASPANLASANPVADVTVSRPASTNMKHRPRISLSVIVPSSVSCINWESMSLPVESARRAAMCSVK